MDATQVAGERDLPDGVGAAVAVCHGEARCEDGEDRRVRGEANRPGPKRLHAWRQAVHRVRRTSAHARLAELAGGDLVTEHGLLEVVEHFIGLLNEFLWNVDVL